ncbi:uncharacterized protein [Aristolochia californica]|uniref:uncharacterized protein n=1 Tax=Aristolochia californica TaxID=171875 RepID=UPI0035D8D587
MGKRRGVRDPVNKLFGWVRRRSAKVKTFLGTVATVSALVALWYFVRDHNHFFVASEAVHAAGIVVLIYKLTKKKTCSGLSLKSQEITALFVAVRLYCSLMMENDIHTFLDGATLMSTLWVIYMIRFKLKSTYIKELDNMQLYRIVVAAAILALFVHPVTPHYSLNRFFWAFSVYLESVSVLPQLRLMQNAKMVEPFTGHYVFALGISRFLSCAHWILRIVETRGRYFYIWGGGYLWVPAILISETVQTFILADFCYYYVKSIVDGQLLVRLPCPV